MVGAQAVAAAAGEAAEVVAEYLDATALGQRDAADQAEQRALAAAAGAVQEDAFAGGDGEIADLQARRRLARPAEGEVGDADGVGHGERSSRAAYQASDGVFGVSRPAPWPLGPTRCASIR